MRRLLVDADVASYIFKWHPFAPRYVELLADNEVVISFVTPAEMRLGARKAKTAHVPVVLDPLVAASMLGHIFEGVNGDSVYRGASFLAGKLGEKIAARTGPS